MYMFTLYAEKGSERERLFDGGTGTDDIKPRLRTPQEIMAKYRKAGVMLKIVLVLTSDCTAVFLERIFWYDMVRTDFRILLR